MSKYDDAINLMEERCGKDKEIVLALATISHTGHASGSPVPAVRMVCAYYDKGAFYVSTDATTNKVTQIEKNNEVSVGSLDWYSLQGYAENLGWVKDENNSQIRSKFSKVFDWFAEVGDENNRNSIVLRITPTKGTIIDNDRKYGESKYEVDFINRVAR
ncbi:pyridoxamine 5'-phosphate oxidase family protein [Photobacterium lutimaris]|uniref:Pyridoxamine 5''-phosphate oxidase n=1 Tax=Photobacterium lutimaris TaxID=388278 RepID=A0A2T3J0J3_9GAMM|nr:pyridoxamine 5'-phosphate oxidase family protein [Photobacterium lutimaris]PSU34583.1 pyridoxamine 5''-phosphate oxidase [Photobacterium lutimaris]TDR71582.1 pyridoxamine 5'-phosphate oxidase [Photobacterium lutimaris]